MILDDDELSNLYDVVREQLEAELPAILDNAEAEVRRNLKAGSPGIPETVPMIAGRRIGGDYSPDYLPVASRMLELRAIDESNLAVDVIVSTEEPVPMFDRERGEVVPEVLLVAGAELPERVPFLNAHNRTSINSLIGSVVDITPDSDVVTGRAVFSSADANLFRLVADGHATDVSAGYSVLERRHVRRGTTETIAGREFTGPVNVATKWRLREVSLVPIGADMGAKVLN